jgi:hypothetical protein
MIKIIILLKNKKFLSECASSVELNGVENLGYFNYAEDLFNSKDIDRLITISEFYLLKRVLFDSSIKKLQNEIKITKKVLY